MMVTRLWPIILAYCAGEAVVANGYLRCWKRTVRKVESPVQLSRFLPDLNALLVTIGAVFGLIEWLYA
jgi:hypothetical protein